MSPMRIGVIAFLLVVSVGCGAGLEPIAAPVAPVTPPAPPTREIAGLLRVEVTTVTTGVRLDPDGYAVENDPWDYDVDSGMIQPVPTNGTASIYLRPGPHFIGLVGVAANCSGENINGLYITVEQGGVTKIVYRLVCT